MAKRAYELLVRFGQGEVVAGAHIREMQLDDNGKDLKETAPIPLAGPAFRHKNTANEYPWMLYSPGTDVRWYIRDIVNSRMQMTFTPGASASAAVTQIHSVLNVEGSVTSTFSSSTADLSALDLSAGQSRLHKNTTSGDLKLFANDGGTIKTITLT